MRQTAAVITIALPTFCAALSPAEASDLVDAVMIQGAGELTICRSLVVYTSCTTHKVHLPEHVAVGDMVELSYGSNPKNHMFRIARIRREGSGCIVLSADNETKDNGERIEVARCDPASEPSTEAR